MVLAKHGVDSLREFGVICLVNATGVNPKVFQAILSGLFSAEPDLLIARLLIARLLLASAICQVFEGDLLRIRSPCVGKYRIGRDCIVANQVLSEAELASVAASQKSHCFG